MDYLNNDCLIEFIKLLNLKDQISVYQVNSQLQVAVKTLWLIKFKHAHINFLEVALTNEEFAIWLQNVHEDMTALQLRFLNREKYEILKEFQFEHLTEFRFTLSKPYFMTDSDLKELQKVLPNLKVFSPHGNFTGLYMDEWPFLKDLNLSYCFKLEMTHFQNIVRHLKLEKLKLNIFPNTSQFESMNLQTAQVDNLKYLELNTFEFYYFLARPLAALKELIITNYYNPRQLFDVLLSIWQARDIRLVETANVDNILLNCVEMQLNVERLTIVNDENALPCNIIPCLHQLTNLRKLRFNGCAIKAKLFIELLKNILQLNEISFENCQFDAAAICIRVEEVFANRVAKLKLNMFENKLADNLDRPVWHSGMDEMRHVLVDIVGSQNVFKLTHSKGDSLCYEPLYVEFR